MAIELCRAVLAVAGRCTPRRVAEGHVGIGHGKLFTLGISGIVTAFGATGGRIVWQTAAPSEASFFGAASSPAVEDDLVIVNPGNYEPLTAFDVTTGEVASRRGRVLRVADRDLPRGRSSGDRSHAKECHLCVDRGWTRAVELSVGGRFGRYHAVVKARNVVFLLNDDGELIVARSSRSGFEPLRRYRVAESATWAQPAISGRRLFIKDVSSLALWALH